MPRRDDDLFEIPSIVPDTESRASRAGKSRPAPAGRSSNSTAPSRLATVGWHVFLVAALLALSATSAFFYQQHSLQKVINEQQQKRLAVMEAQLGLTSSKASETSETLEQRIKSLDDKLKLADSEIRKLWGVTNDKNIKALNKHEESLVEISKSQQALTSSLGELKKAVAQAEKTAGEASRAANESKQGLADSSKNLSEMRNSVGNLQQRLTQGDPLVREASQRATMAQEQVDLLQEKLDSLRTKVAEHEETLRSIDTFRRSVNNDINKLKQQRMGFDGAVQQ